MELAGRSCLTQSWSYGEAKRGVEGWSADRRVITRRGDPFAIVQVLSRRYFGVLTIRRVNRGPLFLHAPTPRERRETLALIGRLGNGWTASVLSISPELDASGDVEVDLALSGFRRLDRPAWSSAWVDLSIELPALRAALDRKWRNMLTSSEKQELSLLSGDADELWRIMRERHEAHMEDKHFQGISLAMLDGLRADAHGDVKLQVFLAVQAGEPSAGVCIARHGVSATYLVGWTTDAGRQARATHFLLWQAIVAMRGAGCHWFDLGGIDEIATPGVARFKLGVNGHRFTLAGEYLHV